MGLAEVLWLIKLNLIAPSPPSVDPPTLDNPYNYSQVVTLLSYRLGHTYMRPFGSAMDWNLMPWTLLWPLYITLCHSLGLEIGLTVPSMLSKAAPFAEIASAYICSAAGFRISLFQLVIL